MEKAREKVKRQKRVDAMIHFINRNESEYMLFMRLLMSYTPVQSLAEPLTVLSNQN